MNKIVKATIASAAGVTLLLGGAGTFAYWNDSVTASGATIAAGNLQVEDSNEAAIWSANGQTISIDDYRIVPGDELTYSKTLNVLAEGDVLQATLGLTDAAITAASTGAADVALQEALVASAKLSIDGEGITANEDGTFTVVPGSGVLEEQVTVEATIAFPTAADDAQQGAVSLSDFTVTLTQVTS